MNTASIIKTLFETLKPVQKDMFLTFYNIEGRKFCCHSSRRLGKTYLLSILSIITALHKSNSQIRYASVTQKSVRKMIHPIFKEVSKKIPAKFRPKWNSQEGAYIFPNGSQVHVAGVNNGHADDLRGTAADLAVIDEASFIDDLTYLTESVLMPQLLTIPNSKLIMASSSPLSPSHEFVNYINEARLNGSYSSYDITQGGYPEEIVEEFIKEAGGRNSTTCRREYFNEIITDSEYAIVPEWDSKKYVKEVGRDEYYKFYHHYRSADWGVRDKTAILWGYYNFKSAQLIIEDEFTCSGQDSTTRNIANNIKSKETNLGYKNIYRSPADNNNLILLQDLGLEFDTHFYATNKDTLAAMVNELRLWVQNGRIIINPRCKELISCLEFGVFSDNKRKEFGRSKSLGHFDALAALIYLVRNVDQNTNPIPTNHNTTPYSHFTPPRSEEIDNQFKKIFNL